MCYEDNIFLDNFKTLIVYFSTWTLFCCIYFLSSTKWTFLFHFICNTTASIIYPTHANLVEKRATHFQQECTRKFLFFPNICSSRTNDCHFQFLNILSVIYSSLDQEIITEGAIHPNSTTGMPIHSMYKPNQPLLYT